MPIRSSVIGEKGLFPYQVFSSTIDVVVRSAQTCCAFSGRFFVSRPSRGVFFCAVCAGRLFSSFRYSRCGTAAPPPRDWPMIVPAGSPFQTLFKA